MSEVATERVLVVPTEVFHRIGHFQGFCHEPEPYLEALFRPEYFSYRPRGEVEQDPGFKQLIPYMIFRHRAGGAEMVFQYTRGKGMGEGRLHLKHSVGIGGHISTVDAAASPSDNPYEEGMRRELEEEVRVDTPCTSQCVGLINDDETEVGRVHLGVVHLFDCTYPEVFPREPDILRSGFRLVEEILADLDGFETWSSICMKALFDK